MGVLADYSPGDYYDGDAIFRELSRAFRAGVLSTRRRHDPHTAKKRLIRDSEALLNLLAWTARDLAGARRWGYDEAMENNRLRGRIEELFGLLTDDQKATMRERDTARRQARLAEEGLLL